MLEEEDKKKNEQIQQCLARKDEMQKSYAQSKDTKYSLLESDARRRATHLLRRAFEIKQEQEDEVRYHLLKSFSFSQFMYCLGFYHF